MRKIFSGILLFLLLSSTLTLAFNVKHIEAWTGTVYIRADGSIYPPDAPIITTDLINYTLIDDIDITYGGTGLIIERNDIILTGNGHKLTGRAVEEGSCGIIVKYAKNVTIRDLRIEYVERGIYFISCDNNVIYFIDLFDNGWGIDLWNSHNNRISVNHIENTGVGVRLQYSKSNEIYGNVIINNRVGFELSLSSENNYLYNNDFINCGLILSDSYANEIIDNRVNYKPLVYLERASNVIVKNAGQVILLNCSHIRVEGFDLSNVTIGVQLINSNNSIITGNTVRNNKWDGIYLINSYNNTIQRNQVENNTLGIYALGCFHNKFSQNNMENNYFYGLFLSNACQNSISENMIVNNKFTGIMLDHSDFNNFFENTISECGSGITLSESYGNIVSENNILNNRLGVHLYFANANKFYHNKFVNNSRQVECYESSNTWDDNYPSGGNFWSDYQGVDEKSGPNQDQPGSDGIGDTPYVIDDFNIDHYPLILQPPDSTPPITHHNYDNLWHTTDFIVTLVATDDLSGVKETFYRVNNGPVMSVGINGHPRFTVESANNTLEYWSVDNAGNEESHKFLTGVKLDKTPPIISINSPVDGAVFSTSTITFCVTATDLVSGVNKVELYIDDRLQGSMNFNGMQYTLTVPSITDGNHVWQAKVYDNAGWTETTPLTTFVVNLPSSVNRQIGVKSGDWVKYQIEGSASDGVAWIVIEVENVDAPKSTVAFCVTLHYYNGTERSDTFYLNLATGRYEPEGHYFASYPFIFANLEVGEAPYESWPNYTIQNEMIKTYCGAKRQVLYFHIDEVSDSTDPSHVIVNAYWDKVTGVLLEFELTQDGQTLKMTAIETNLWSTSQQEKPPDYVPLYYIAGAIVILSAVIIVTYSLVKKKSLKPQSPTPPQPPSTTVPLSVKRCIECGSDIPLDAVYCPKCGFKQESAAKISEIKKYRQYLEKLEQKYKAGEISDDIYQKLKSEYLEKLKEYGE
jgi:parallel beta-helix repeat protein